MTRMYAHTQTWNIYVGCGFDCTYCKPSFQAQLKRWGKGNCRKCYDYVPHLHLERLDRMPKADLVFVGGFGDPAFLSRARKIAVLGELAKREEQLFLWQSKDPGAFRDIEFPPNVIFGTTIETNRDTTLRFSKAPRTADRYIDLFSHGHTRKSVTIEPIMDFDEDDLLHWIKNIAPEIVWVGFDSRNCKLPEPCLSKTHRFLKAMRDQELNVIEKVIRPRWDWKEWQERFNAGEDIYGWYQEKD